MGFKSIEVIIGACLVLNELPKYLDDKMMMLATFIPLGNSPIRTIMENENICQILHTCKTGPNVMAL